MRVKDSGYLPPLPRPAVPPLFSCALSFWVCCAVALATGYSREGDASALVAVVSLAVCLAALAVAGTGRIRMAALVAASMAAGIALGCAQAAMQLANAAEYGTTDATVSVTLTMGEDSREGYSGERAIATIEGESQPPVKCIATLQTSEPFLVGDRVRAVGTFSAVDYATNRNAWQKGACVLFKASSWVAEEPIGPLGDLRQLRAHAIEALDGEGDSPAILQAVVCGYRRNIEDTVLYGQFQTCGLAHLIAVSGAHLVLVCGLVASLLRWARVPRPASVAVTLAVMGSYYVLAGMPVSALRACVMSSLGLLAYFGARRPSTLNAVGAAVFGLVMVEPTTSIAPSFALSVLATTGIVLFAPLISRWLHDALGGRLPGMTDALALTAASALTSQAYATSLFGQLPLVAPLANIVVAPVFPLVCGTGTLALLAVGCGVPSEPVLAIAQLASSILGVVVGMLSAIPYASVPYSLDAPLALAASALAVAVLWTLWPRRCKTREVVTLALILLVGFAPCLIPTYRDEIVMLDVGQGDSFLIRSRGETLLVDTGNQDSQLLKELGANHVLHIDTVLITHSDDDHCGALDALQKSTEVDRVVVAADMLACDDEGARKLVRQADSMACEVIGVHVGDRFTVGAFEFEVIWPRSFHADGGNPDSVCLVADYDGDADGTVDFKAAFTGDAEKEQIEELLRSGALGHVDILKVGHHGSRNGMTGEQVEAIDPGIALISCGKGNRYGHPAPETLALLEDAGCRVFRTDQDGEVRCTIGPDAVKVSCKA